MEPVVELTGTDIKNMDLSWMTPFLELFIECAIKMDDSYIVTNLRRKNSNRLAAASIVGKSFLDFVAEKDRIYVDRELNRLKKEIVTYVRFQCLSTIGRYYRWTISAYYEKDNLAGYHGVAVDVTEQTLKEITLNWQRAIIEEGRDFIRIFDVDDNILYTNPGAYKMTGYEGILPSSKTIYTPEHYQRVYSEGLAAVKEHGYWTSRGEIIHVDGSLIPVEHTMYSVVDDNDEIIIIATLIKDITSFLEHEKKLDEARKNAEAASIAKSNFLATMSHEIRTPMNAIIGISQVQMQRGDLPEEYATALEKIFSSANGLMGIINDILDMSKIETGKLELIPVEYDIPSLINDVAQLNIMRIASKPIEFILDIDPKLPSKFYGDELRLKQIFNNLISNAIKYTDSGHVKLSVTFDDTAEDPILSISVSDTGHGIKTDDLDKLFTDYTRFNYKENLSTEGTGLGLSITKSLVKLMGGHIVVESEYGIGSTFHVYVKQKSVQCEPIGEVLAEQLRNFSFSGEKLHRKLEMTYELMPYGKILIVDDVETNLYVAEGMMSLYELQIDTVTSGYSAISKIQSGKVYDIIFMDHMMPIMDGIETTHKLRSIGYKGAIVALTANAIVGNAEMFLANGFDDFIPKPINTQQLRDILYKFVHDKHLAEAKRYKDTVYKVSGNTKTSIDTKLFKTFLKDAQKAIMTIRETLDNNDIKLYTTTVHAMKSALTNINETETAEIAGKLESAGRENNLNYIETHTMTFVNLLEKLIEDLTEDEPDKPHDDDIYEDLTILHENLKAIRYACEEYKDETVYVLIDSLREHTWKKDTISMLEKIHDLLFYDSDFDAVADLIDSIL